MSNVLTLKTDNPDLFHAEATPHGVNIMTRNDAGMRLLTAVASSIWSGNWLMRPPPDGYGLQRNRRDPAPVNGGLRVRFRQQYDGFWR